VVSAVPLPSASDIASSSLPKVCAPPTPGARFFVLTAALPTAAGTGGRRAEREGTRPLGYSDGRIKVRCRRLWVNDGG
jgi:hypothetical protein